jgi:hypothetical protein
VGRESHIAFLTAEGPSCGEGYTGSTPRELAEFVGVPLLEFTELPSELDPIPQFGFTYIYLDPGKKCGVSQQFGLHPRSSHDASLWVRIYHPLSLSEIRLGTPPPLTAEAEISQTWSCWEFPSSDIPSYATNCNGELYGFYVQVLSTYSVERSEEIVQNLRVAD